MKESHGKGPASHPDPESCVDGRKAGDIRCLQAGALGRPPSDPQARTRFGLNCRANKRRLPPGVGGRRLGLRVARASHLRSVTVSVTGRDEARLLGV
jgi:hypothetical protein